MKKYIAIVAVVAVVGTMSATEARGRTKYSSYGSTGSIAAGSVAPSETKTIQQRLKDLGYDPGPVDGVAGGQTEIALKRFQEDHGLVVDGVAGQETKRALGVM